jgi:hypothetical protein
VHKSGVACESIRWGSDFDLARNRTAPSMLVEKLIEIAAGTMTSRLDIIGFALSRFIHEELR